MASTYRHHHHQHHQHDHNNNTTVRAHLPFVLYDSLQFKRHTSG